MEFTRFPREVLWKIFALVPSLLEFRVVNRKFHYLHNEFYMAKTLQIIGNIDKNKMFWDELRKPIIDYIKSLDFLRRHARLIYARSGDEEEFIDDSWFIIYGVLGSPWKCWDNPSLCQRDSLEYHRPPYVCNCVVPVENNDGSIYAKAKSKSYPLQIGDGLPLNAWFLIDKPISPSQMLGFHTEIRPLHSADVHEMETAAGSLADIKEKGIYCFNIGNISSTLWNNEDDSLNNCGFIPLQIKLKSIELEQPIYYSKKSSIIFLGYDFKSYGANQSWIFFRCDCDFAKRIFNPFERYLEKRLGTFTGAFPSSQMQVRGLNIEESIEPYFDTNQRAIRKFVYGYPEAEQDSSREWETADWRAPRLFE